MRVAIIGTGYVGLTTGACLAFLGHEVTCLDTDEAKIAMLREGKTPIYEPHLTELLADARANLHFTRSYPDALRDADVVFIAVGTPQDAVGAPDLQYLRAAAREIGANLCASYTVIVNKSTVPIGSANWVESIVREAFEAANPEGGSTSFCVASNPEFLREGSAIGDTLYPDRIVIGASDERGRTVLEKLYGPVLKQDFPPPAYLPRPVACRQVPLIATDVASAELVKYAANAFLALKISYINEIDTLAGCVGADTRDVAKGIGLDARIGSSFLKAGIGWGGSCFGKDTSALVATASEYGVEMPIVQAARRVNLLRRELVVTRLLCELKILKGRTIGLLGVAFKPETDDLRDAPALDIARTLIQRGAKVKVHDPVALERLRAEHSALQVVSCDSVEALASGADALVLMTEWRQYLELDWSAIAPLMRSPVLLDGRYALDAERLAACGFRYLGLTDWMPRKAVSARAAELSDSTVAAQK